MAGLGRKVFASGEILTAADLQGYAVDQSVMVFADSSARSAAISSPSEGMTTYLESTNTLEFWNGSAWVEVGGEQGKLKQVVYSFENSIQTTSSTTFQDTGLTATITPTASDSKVLAMVTHMGVLKNTGDSGVGFQLLQDGTLFVGQFAANMGRTGNNDLNEVGSASFQYLFSPGTTSAVVYKTQFKCNNGNTSVSVQSAGISSMVLMEIGA